MAELDARERILKACRNEIARYGERGLRVQRVAKQAGVSLGLVYYHFDDRVGLLNATVDYINEAAERRGRRAAMGMHGMELLEQILLSEFDDDIATRDGSVVWNEIRAAAVFEPEMQPALRASTARWEQSLMSALAEAGVSATEMHSRAILLTAIVEGLSSRWLSGQIAADTARNLMRIGLVGLMHSELAPSTE